MKAVIFGLGLCVALSADYALDYAKKHELFSHHFVIPYKDLEIMDGHDLGVDLNSLHGIESRWHIDSLEVKVIAPTRNMARVRLEGVIEHYRRWDNPSFSPYAKTI